MTKYVMFFVAVLWIVLSSDIFNNNEIKAILNNPPDYIESSDYVSWERFFTDLLESKTADKHGMEYHKRSLNAYYLSDRNITEILSVLNCLLDE